MNKITIHLKVSITLMFFLNICFAQGTFAQTGFTLQWDSEVGCLTYDDDRKEKPLEDLDDGECITACENSTINFKLLFNEQLQDVARIDWESDGGVVSSVSSDETEASIDWPTAMTNGEVTVKITMTNGEVIYNSLCINVKPKPVASYETANSKELDFIAVKQIFILTIYHTLQTDHKLYTAFGDLVMVIIQVKKTQFTVTNNQECIELI